MLVNELSSMVSTNSRKMDKSTVLKSTISFLKNHNGRYFNFYIDVLNFHGTERTLEYVTPQGGVGRLFR